MKGIMSVIEVMVTGLILIMAFLHFFPQYSVRTQWDKTLLATEVMDTLNTIDRLGKTYDFATCSTAFNDFTSNLFTPETSGAMIWWKETDNLEGYAEDMSIPYFTQGYKESMVDVEVMSDEYTVDGDTVALWHFNEGSGTNLDNAQGDASLDGTLNGNGDEWTVGKLNSTLYFDGTNDYINVLDHDSFDMASFTLEAWIKTSNAGIGRRVIVVQQSGDYWALSFYNNQLEICSSFDSQLDDSGFGYPCSYYNGRTLNDNIWHHVAGVRKTGDYVKWYIDGINVKTITISNSDTYQISANVLIGRDGGNRFNGKIDEVRISNVARTTFDIRYNAYSYTLGLGYPY